MILNRQKGVAVNLRALRAYVGRLQAALGVGRREFNVCFVTDREIRRLNSAYRGQARPTDVLSFPWEAEVAERCSESSGEKDFRNFLGDVVISADTARRKAGAEGHSTQDEIRWLILHGVLHLLGYDHESDQGEMTARELALRDRLGIAQSARRQPSPRKRRSRAG